jgi:hypothetical protein
MGQKTFSETSEKQFAIFSGWKVRLRRKSSARHPSTMTEEEREINGLGGA